MYGTQVEEKTGMDGWRLSQRGRHRNMREVAARKARVNTLRFVYVGREAREALKSGRELDATRGKRHSDLLKHWRPSIVYVQPSLSQVDSDVRTTRKGILSPIDSKRTTAGEKGRRE